MQLPEGWQKAQAAKCGCRGTDDLCACVNVYDPAKYGLAVIEKCGDCGLLASSLMHRFCERPNCAVREHLALIASGQDGPADRPALPRETQSIQPPGGLK